MNLRTEALNVAEHVADTIASNPKTAVAVPFGTSLIAPLTDLAQLQGILSVVSMVLGIVISLVILRHRWITLKQAEIELERLKNDDR